MIAQKKRIMQAPGIKLETLESHNPFDVVHEVEEETLGSSPNNDQRNQNKRRKNLSGSSGADHNSSQENGTGKMRELEKIDFKNLKIEIQVI